MHRVAEAAEEPRVWVRKPNMKVVAEPRRGHRTGSFTTLAVPKHEVPDDADDVASVIAAATPSTGMPTSLLEFVTRLG